MLQVKQFWQFQLIRKKSGISIFVDLRVLLSFLRFTTRLNCAMYFIAIILHFAFICFPPTYLKEESEETCYSVYKSNWYKNETNEIRRYIPFIIQHTQKIVVISGGGMFNVDRTTFVQVNILLLKKIVSIIQLISGFKINISSDSFINSNYGKILI